MKLASLLQEEFVLCRAEAATYAEAQACLVESMGDAINSGPEPILAALQEREALGSTVIAPGIGFPHARIDAVDGLCIGVGTFPAGVSAEGQDAPVRLVVLFLLPEGASNLYLGAVSAFTKFLATGGGADRLVDAESSEALIRALDEAGVVVKETITASDIMDPSPAIATADSTLREVADMMVKTCSTHVPVVDGEGRYQGMVTAAGLLRVGLPDYLLSMDNVAFLSEFEPFQDLLKQEQSMTVGEIVNTSIPHFNADDPMIVVAAALVRHNLSCAAVLEDGKLVGTISWLRFVHKVVRA